ncbi:S1 family peptidase [Actinoallomurus sp. CA-142502]|uniref:S1 family peptidase n=1 Tax=Actinoallomurus sp. CA-142502 TaxID=3239885 RepID=UPI003D91DAC2
MRPRRRRIGRGIGAAVALVAAVLLVPSAARADTASGETRARQVARTLGPVAGTASLLDPRSGTVVVLADRTVTGARLARVQAATRPFGDAVRLRRIDGVIGLRLSGGDPVTGGAYRCTAGANVTGGGAYYFVTAGHCGAVVSTWYTVGGALIGPTAGTSFPGNDYSVVRYTGNVPHDGTVGQQDITRAGNAYVGERVCMRGGTSGVHCGTVLALNATVNYAEGTVSGLIETNICSEPGDSGAPLYDGSTLLGVLSGGTGDCSSGGVTFFQPITEILSAYGLTVF